MQVINWLFYVNTIPFSFLSGFCIIFSSFFLSITQFFLLPILLSKRIELNRTEKLMYVHMHIFHFHLNISIKKKNKNRAKEWVDNTISKCDNQNTIIQSNVVGIFFTFFYSRILAILFSIHKAYVFGLRAFIHFLSFIHFQNIFHLFLFFIYSEQNSIE